MYIAIGLVLFVFFVTGKNPVNDHTEDVNYESKDRQPPTDRGILFVVHIRDRKQKKESHKHREEEEKDVFVHGVSPFCLIVREIR